MKFTLQLMGISVALALFITGLCVVVGIVEVDNDSFDTQAVDAWDGNCADGEVRMMDAWVDDGLLIDCYGEAWYYEDVDLDPNGFYLLWVADNNTPKDVEDDIIIKVWAEVN